MRALARLTGGPGSAGSSTAAAAASAQFVLAQVGRGGRDHFTDSVHFPSPLWEGGAAPGVTSTAGINSANLETNFIAYVEIS